MKVTFNLDTIKPMIEWLKKYKLTGNRDENKLKEILDMPDYQIEFMRYGLEGLPVCGISYEEAVDFFMNFDKKEFDNQRLQYKKASFLAFFDDIEQREQQIDQFTEISNTEQSVIENLLAKGLPDRILNDIEELNIILIVSIGNSMGWPYDHYIDYDIANLNLIGSMDDFLHLTAHEIHHVLLGNLLGADGISGEAFFLQNFAFEGLAVHFNNNQKTRMKPQKYEGKTYLMQKEDMDFYEEHFDEIFTMIKQDYELSKTLSLEDVAQLVSNHYERFEFLGKPVQQYPTYYFGCYMWGLVDLAFGKEMLFKSIEEPALFVELYNQVAEERYRF